MDAINDHYETISERGHERFFRKRYTGTIAFGVGILLFLMPFAEFKCGDTAIIGNTGIGIAIGSPWKIAGGMDQNELKEKLGTTAKLGQDAKSDGPNIFALVSIAAALFGIGISFSHFPWRRMAGMCAGILAAVMLLAMMIQYKMEMRSALREGGVGDTIGLGLGSILKLSFTIWYYLSVLSFLIAAFLNYMHDKLLLRDAIHRSMDFEFQKEASPVENHQR